MEKDQQAIPQELECKIKLWIREAISEQMQFNSEVQDLVSIEEAMRITHLARQTLYGLKFGNKIPFVKRPNSKKLFFSRKALLNWMQNKSNE